MRRLTEYESKALHNMLRAKYCGGQDPDTLADDGARFLRARGWDRTPADRRAQEAACLAVADVDGLAGGGQS